MVRPADLTLKYYIMAKKQSSGKATPVTSPDTQTKQTRTAKTKIISPEISYYETNKKNEVDINNLLDLSAKVGLNPAEVLLNYLVTLYFSSLLCQYAHAAKAATANLTSVAIQTGMTKTIYTDIINASLRSNQIFSLYATFCILRHKCDPN